jgi:tripartite-type tricarboxylate transporter receptor subunit TctC
MRGRWQALCGLVSSRIRFATFRPWTVSFRDHATRQEFDQFLRGEVARWARVIKEAGIPQQ